MNAKDHTTSDKLWTTDSMLNLVLEMHVTDVTLGVYKQNLNAGLLLQHHFWAGSVNGNISSSHAILYQAKAGFNISYTKYRYIKYLTKATIT